MQSGEKQQLKAMRIFEREYPQIAEAPVHQRKRVHRLAEQDRERVRIRVYESACAVCSVQCAVCSVQYACTRVYTCVW